MTILVANEEATIRRQLERTETYSAARAALPNKTANQQAPEPKKIDKVANPLILLPFLFFFLMGIYFSGSH